MFFFFCEGRESANSCLHSGVAKENSEVDVVWQAVHGGGVAGLEEAVRFLGLSVEKQRRIYYSVCLSGTNLKYLRGNIFAPCCVAC